jgi:hypothetical protein
VAAPRYDTLSAARHGHQAATGAGTHPSPTRPPSRTDSRHPDPRHPALAANSPGEPEPAGGAELPHGFSVAEVERLVRRAVSASVASSLDPEDAYETAWGTIVERLCAATSRPVPGHLVVEARRALGDHVQADREYRGLPTRGRTYTRDFDRYWDWEARPIRSPEGPIVERLALAQIMSRLTVCQRSKLLMLAATGDHAAAAAALGLRRSAFSAGLAYTRRKVLALWHEHETPSRLWRSDQRAEAMRRRVLGHDRERCRCVACVAWRANPANQAAAGVGAVGA